MREDLNIILRKYYRLELALIPPGMKIPLDFTSDPYLTMKLVEDFHPLCKYDSPNWFVVVGFSIGFEETFPLAVAAAVVHYLKYCKHPSTS